MKSTSYLENGKKSEENRLVDSSSNISYSNGKVSILSPGEAYLTLEEPTYRYRSTYRFNVVDGVNVYSYSDLLLGTNKSQNGENIVLQVNLESLKNTYSFDTNKNRYIDTKLSSNEDNTELFGNFDFASQTFSFDEEYYTFTTTYDSTYIDQYNKEKNASVKKDVIAGIHLRKNLYGNGFSINMNGLCYPNHGEIDKYTGKRVPKRKKKQKQGRHMIIFMVHCLLFQSEIWFLSHLLPP